jgi:fumarate reductase flavoprotein subunit
MADLIVAGAGMAGLVAAAHARQVGADVRVLEKLDRVGGSMRLSSGFIWRHRDFGRFRSECPDGEEALQRLLFDRLDHDLDWLRSLGAPVVSADTGNPLTTGIGFDPAGLTRALAEAAGKVELDQALRELPDGAPVVLATGGFPASGELLRRHVTPEAGHLALRAAPGGEGDGIRLGLRAGGRLSTGIEQIYGRHMPAPPARVAARDYVRLAQRYARHAEVANERGERCPPTRSWAEIDVFQWTARQPRARAWFRVSEDRLGERVRDRTVGEMVDTAAVAGAPVLRKEGAVVVETVAGVTRTLGGLAVDESARVAPGVFAAGDDAGGVASGGYASGLAAALVLGRVAAAAALGETPR